VHLVDLINRLGEHLAGNDIALDTGLSIAEPVRKKSNQNCVWQQVMGHGRGVSASG